MINPRHQACLTYVANRGGVLNVDVVRDFFQCAPQYAGFLVQRWLRTHLIVPVLSPHAMDRCRVKRLYRLSNEALSRLGDHQHPIKQPSVRPAVLLQALTSALVWSPFFGLGSKRLGPLYPDFQQRFRLIPRQERRAHLMERLGLRHDQGPRHPLRPDQPLVNLREEVLHDQLKDHHWLIWVPTWGANIEAEWGLNRPSTQRSPGFRARWRDVLGHPQVTVLVIPISPAMQTACEVLPQARIIHRLDQDLAIDSATLPKLSSLPPPSQPTTNPKPTLPGLSSIPWHQMVQSLQPLPEPRVWIWYQPAVYQAYRRWLNHLN